MLLQWDGRYSGMVKTGKKKEMMDIGEELNRKATIAGILVSERFSCNIAERKKKW